MKIPLSEMKGGEGLKQMQRSCGRTYGYVIDFIRKVSPVSEEIIQAYFTNEMRKHNKQPFETRLWKLCHLISESPGVPIMEVTRTFADTCGIHESTAKKFRLGWGIKKYSKRKKVEIEAKIAETKAKREELEARIAEMKARRDESFSPNSPEKPVSFFATVADALDVFSKFFRERK